MKADSTFQSLKAGLSSSLEPRFPPPFPGADWCIEDQFGSSPLPTVWWRGTPDDLLQLQSDTGRTALHSDWVGGSGHKRELQYYLKGQRFTHVTDHAHLQWLMRYWDVNSKLTRCLSFNATWLRMPSPVTMWPKQALLADRPQQPHRGEAASAGNGYQYPSIAAGQHAQRSWIWADARMAWHKIHA